MSDAKAPGIQISKLTKRYANTVALDGLDLEIVPGEVLGVAGPNGAGKSTLVRMLAGEEQPSSGTLSLDGRPWSPSRESHVASVVHQEPQLFPNLTVAENMVVGREHGGPGWPKPSAADLATMDTMGLGKLRNAPLGECSLAIQQRTEIARAVARDARVFLFDEPNSALTDAESDELFREIHKLADSGRIVILITHRLGDLVKHCRRVAVVRDGRVRATLTGNALTEEGLALQLVTEGAVARASGSQPQSNGSASAAPMFSVRHWTSPGRFTPFDFSAQPGEIVALMGVEGSGAREVLRSFAALQRAHGDIALAGNGDIESRRAYVPATRSLSLYTNFSVGENLLVRLGAPDIATAWFALRKKQMTVLAQQAVRRFLVKTPTITQPIRSLSGGNQQKVAIAQALNGSPDLLLLEEPTRGVDIHSKAEIYHLLREYASSGKVVIVFCTEALEIFELADRAHVVSDGRLSAPLRVADYDHVEKLATDISRLEQRRGAAA